MSAGWGSLRFGLPHPAAQHCTQEHSDGEDENGDGEAMATVITG